MKLYKGYTKNKGKKPVDKIADVDEYRTFEDVRKFDSYGGVLADDAVLIDVDDKEQSEILMRIVEDYQLNCQVTCTERGRHFTFINNGITKGGKDLKLACGIIADVKVGNKNAVECLKIDGEERFIEWEYDDENDGVLPVWLRPVKTSIDFFRLGAGEGRNDALFRYILNLTTAGFTKNESRECLCIINKYILADSLSEDEINTIMRDDAFPKETFYDGKTFLHNNFATFIKNNDYIKRINGQLHVYRDGVYVPGMRELEASMIKYLPNLKAAQRVETLKYLDIICDGNSKVADANLIAFNNGIYDIVSGEITNFSPDIVITNKIPWDYNSEAYSELADDTLNKLACGDKSIRDLLEEAIGYSFYRRNEMSKAFFLTGSGANGKSTFIGMLNDLVGDENKSALGLEELDERFSIVTLANKLINTGDDISEDFLQGRTVAVFKKLVSGNEIKAEYKGQDAFFMKPYTKFFFSANALPRTKSKGFGALMRRLVIIPFDATFTKDSDDYDPFVRYKLKDKGVMEYLIRIGIEALKRVIERQAFSDSEKVTKQIEDYEIENNPIILWLQDINIMIDIENQPTKDVYRAYRVFCLDNGFAEMTLKTFSRELKLRCCMTTKNVRINGKVIKIYVREENL